LVVMCELVSVVGIAGTATAVFVLLTPLMCAFAGACCRRLFAMQQCLALGRKVRPRTGPIEGKTARPPLSLPWSGKPFSWEHCSLDLAFAHILNNNLARVFLYLTQFTMAESWKWTSDSKLCFVTTGATAPFTALIESVLSPSCLGALQEGGFTHLLVQYGSARDIYEKCVGTARPRLQSDEKKREFIIDGIDFNPEGLQAQFELVQKSEGLVISHAGMNAIHLHGRLSANTGRIWFYPRGSPLPDTTHSGAQHCTTRQPPRRACCSNGTK